MRKTIKWLWTPTAILGESMMLAAIGCFVSAKPIIGIPVSIILFILACILLIVSYIKTRKENAMAENEKPKNVIKDSEFKTNVDKAVRAVGMEVNQPTELSNVKSELNVKDAQEAIGFSTNQGMTGGVMNCRFCGKLFQFAYTGSVKTVTCRFCRKENPVNP